MARLLRLPSLSELGACNTGQSRRDLSQEDSLCFDLALDGWVHFRPDVDRVTKQLSHLALESEQVEATVAGVEVDEQIDVARGCRVPTRN